jgi:hypothetical protein
MSCAPLFFDEEDGPDWLEANEKLGESNEFKTLLGDDTIEDYCSKYTVDKDALTNLLDEIIDGHGMTDMVFIEPKEAEADVGGDGA